MKPAGGLSGPVRSRPRRDPAGLRVMGGVFGEGVDLVGSRLIGCAIVGWACPRSAPGRRCCAATLTKRTAAASLRLPLSRHEQGAAGGGAGHRTEHDRGVVLLLDDRFAQEGYRRLFPRHWAHLQYLPAPTP